MNANHSLTAGRRCGPNEDHQGQQIEWWTLACGRHSRTLDLEGIREPVQYVFVIGQGTGTAVARAAARGLRLALCCSLVSASAWCGETPSDGADYLVATWRTDDGLPQNAVTRIVQTQDGYLWVGTSNGLARFDGVRFVTFRSAETPGLRNNRILSLCQARNGVLWIGTDGGGLTRYEAGQFAGMTTRDGLSSDRITCLAEDRDGQLWVGTESGLNRLENTRFVSYFTLNGLPDDHTASVLPVRAGVLVAAGKGLASFQSGHFVRLAGGASESWEGARLLLRDRDENLWISTEAGLWRLSSAPGATNAVLVHHGRVGVAVERAGGEIWLGGDDGRLCRLKAGAESPQIQLVARFGAAILALCEDREGNVWAGTAGDGLHRLKPRQLRVVDVPEGLGSGEGAVLVETAPGTAWLAAGVQGVRVCQAGRWETLQPRGLPENTRVRTLADDGAGGLWLGTLGDGLFRWHKGTLQRWNQRDGLSDSAIEALCGDGGQGVWIGTRNGGLNHLQHGKVGRVHTPWGFGGNYAGVMARDRGGRLWIGTTGDGLFCCSNEVFSSYNTRNGLPHDLVHALLPDEDVVWVGTAGGLARIKDGQVTAFTQKDGLPEEAIAQLQDDGAGRLWIGSSRGLFSLSKQQLEEYAEGRVRFLDLVACGKSDGLTDLEVWVGAQVRMAGPPSGRMGFLTSRGLVQVEGRSLRRNLLPPPVVLEQVLVENEAVPFSKPIRVPPGRDKIQFQYTALSLVAPEKVRFRVRLAGFDRDWIDMGGSRTVRYTKVPPGRYDFRVVACNNDGVWSGAEAGTGLTVAPFWWQTVWFRSALALGLGAGVVGAVRLRQTRCRDIERLRVRLAADLHDEIGSSIWSITLLSRMLQKDGQMGAEERRDIGEIHRIATQTSSAIRDIVWLINPAFDTAQDLVLRMRDMAGTILRGVDCRLQCETADLSRKLPLDFRQNVFLLFKEAVTNIAKHAQATRVEILLREADRRWQLVVRDNGVGFNPPANGSGHGLKNLRLRAEKLGGEVSIDSRPGQGTSIVLSVPLG